MSLQNPSLRPRAAGRGTPSRGVRASTGSVRVGTPLGLTGASLPPSQPHGPGARVPTRASPPG